MVALTLLMATSLAGVAWAANVIRCAPRIVVPFCEGTGKNDVMYGTNKADWIGGGQYGADTLYGRDGDDELVGGGGPDTIRGGLATTILLTAITTTGLERTKTTAAGAMIALSVTLCPKSISEREGMIILATTSRSSALIPSVAAPASTKFITTRG